MIHTCEQCQTAQSWQPLTDNICDNCELMNRKPTTTEQARQYAIDWQNWQSEQSLSYGELIAWQEHLNSIALEFDLLDEFKENGII